MADSVEMVGPAGLVWIHKNDVENKLLAGYKIHKDNLQKLNEEEIVEEEDWDEEE